MSKLETPLIRKYWTQVGGTLVEEFPIVSRDKNKNQERRLVDAIIIPEGKNEIKNWREVSLENKKIIIVQAKAKRLGMYLMGQTLFSKQLVEKFYEPTEVTSVAICTKDDVVLKPLLEKYPNTKVIVLKE